MPDITMCQDHKCSKRETCYRYKAVPWEHGQCWFVKSPRKGRACKEYWKLRKHGKQQSLHALFVNAMRGV